MINDKSDVSSWQYYKSVVRSKLEFLSLATKEQIGSDPQDHRKQDKNFLSNIAESKEFPMSNGIQFSWPEK